MYTVVENAVPIFGFYSNLKLRHRLRGCVTFEAALLSIRREI